MKLLALDIGNSEIKYAVLEGGKISEIRRHPTAEAKKLAPELSGIELPLAVSSVRPKEYLELKEELQKHKKAVDFELDWRLNEPVSGFYEGIGADRVAALAAAWLEFGASRPVAVLSFGTATTITTASSAGVFKGGFITLGLGSICAQLTESLPELPAIDPRQARSMEPGFDTYSSICRGTVLAHLGIVKEWLSIFQASLADDMAVIATGGWSEFMAGFLDGYLDKVDPNLTLKGLAAAYSSNKLNPGAR